MSQRQLHPQTLQRCIASARPILIRRARKRDCITCGELLRKMRGRPGRGYIGQVLDEVSRAEAREKRPLLSAIVVHAGTGRSGIDFFYMKELREVKRKVRRSGGRLDPQEDARKEVWDYWETH